MSPSKPGIKWSPFDKPSWWAHLESTCGIRSLVGLMIKRHERTQLFRELPGDCCSSLVTSLSEQKESPILQGDRQLLGSVRESLIAAGGGAAALMWARTAGGCWGESHSSHFCPQGTWSRTETFHTGGFFISFYGCLVLVFFPPSINCNCFCSKIELSWVSLLWSHPDRHRELGATRADSLHQIFKAGLDPDPTGKAMLA